VFVTVSVKVKQCRQKIPEPIHIGAVSRTGTALPQLDPSECVAASAGHCKFAPWNRWPVTKVAVTSLVSRVTK
jgi:hypothetical protein